MRTQLRNAALALTLSVTLAPGVPAVAATAFEPQASELQADTWQQYRQRYDNGSYGQRSYAEPVCQHPCVAGRRRSLLLPQEERYHGHDHRRRSRRSGWTRHRGTRRQHHWNDRGWCGRRSPWTRGPA